MILPGYGRAERDLLLLAASIEKDGHEQRLARQQAFAGAHQRAEESTLLRAAVAEDGFHLDAVVHVHHAAGLGHGGFIRVQLDFDVLHVVAEDLYSISCMVAMSDPFRLAQCRVVRTHNVRVRCGCDVKHAEMVVVVRDAAMCSGSLGWS